MSSPSRLAQPQAVPDIARPRLDLSGPVLAQALQSLVAGTEAQGGIEHWIDAMAHERSALYGILSIVVALIAGWAASALFRFITP